MTGPQVRQMRWAAMGSRRDDDAQLLKELRTVLCGDAGDLVKVAHEPLEDSDGIVAALSGFLCLALLDLPLGACGLYGV